MRRTILKAITMLAGILFIISVACMDSSNNLPFLVISGISGLWLYLMAKANGGLIC